MDTIPSMMCGIWSAAPAGTLTAAVTGLMCSGRCTTTVPRSNGPTFAEVIAAIENGAPSKGPAMYTLPGVYARTVPTPAPTRVCPISLAGGARGFCFLLRAGLRPRERDLCFGAERDAGQVRRQPGGSCEANPVISCSPSLRVIRDIRRAVGAGVVVERCRR